MSDLGTRGGIRSLRFHGSLCLDCMRCHHNIFQVNVLRGGVAEDEFVKEADLIRHVVTPALPHIDRITPMIAI